MHEDLRRLELEVRRARRTRIAPAVHGPGVPLRVEAFHVVGEPISAEDARQATFERFEVGESWGPPWGTTWFRFTATVPEECAGHPVDALVAFSQSGLSGFGAEASVWGDDAPVQGLHAEHQAVRIAEAAKGGENVSLLVEAAANPDLSTSFSPSSLGDPATAGDERLYQLVRAELAPRNCEVYALHMDLSVLASLLEVLPPDEPRRYAILMAMVDSVTRFDPVDAEGSAFCAREPLREVLAAGASASAHEVSAVGHAHIDTAWLWPIRETRRKCARTFSTAVALMDDYPEYRFACSQAQQYEWIRRDHPALFERIREKVAAGQWLPVGGMWVEADANLPSGESLVRQFVHGQRFFRDEFGVECREVWIPDVFGYSAALPQIMRQAGCDRFVTQKLSWNDTNRIPHHTFWWEGLDGSRVLTHFPPADTYNGTMRPAELVRSVHAFRDHAHSRHSLYLFGLGDGGGGPTRDMLERARRLRDLEGAPRVTIESPGEFFEHVERERDHPVWVGELYLEKHRGTYTTQAATKAGNRRAELALREAELWCTAAVARGSGYPADELDALWKLLLTQQFHDVLPGSSIAWVHQEAEAVFGRVVSEASRLGERARESLADGLAAATVVSNALTHDRAEVAIFDTEEQPDTGETQRLSDGRVAAWVEVSGASVAVAPPNRPPGEVVVAGSSMSNGLVSVAWDAKGQLVSVVDELCDREVLAAPGNRFDLFEDRPLEFDAWDIDRSALDSLVGHAEARHVEVVDSGPLMGSVKIESVVGGSPVRQEIRLRAGSRRIDFVTRIDWRESEKLLKVAFPIDVRVATASYEMQFGYVERPTHRNTSWDWARFEVCGHTWADLSEPDFGVALLNDCKYGYDVVGSVMRLTLLRAPRFPDPEADRGVHELTYSLYPHPGDLRTGGVVAAAHELNSPIRPVPVGSRGDGLARRVVEVSHPGVVASAVKQADDGTGDWIVRCYEAWGQRSRAEVRIAEPVGRAQLCDLHERPESEVEVANGAAQLELRPFELATLRVQVATP